MWVVGSVPSVHNDSMLCPLRTRPPVTFIGSDIIAKVRLEPADEKEGAGGRIPAAHPQSLSSRLWPLGLIPDAYYYSVYTHPHTS